MVKTILLYPGITLRCFPDRRFKHGCLSIQFLRTMKLQEASYNALLPTVLLRGTHSAPDLRAITRKLDDLYGASVSALVRRVGDYQTMGLSCSFIEDRFAMPGDRVLEPVVGFMAALLFEPALEEGVFRADYVESEKRNLISALEAQKNDKRAYAASQLIRKMCTRDTVGIPRLGEIEQARSITPEGLYQHYRKVLQESPVEIFYVGSAQPEEVARLLKPLFQNVAGNYVNLEPQTAFTDAPTGEHTETMEVSQGKLCMGFVTPITLRTEDFAAMQVCNVIFGGGMTSKLFLQVREKHSLCYDIGSSYQGTKGIVTVSAGIDFDKEEPVKQQVLQLLEQCRTGQFTRQELASAKQVLCSQLQGTHDTPGSIENYYITGMLSGLCKTPEQYKEAVEAVTAKQVAKAAQSLQLHTVYFLKGVR